MRTAIILLSLAVSFSFGATAHSYTPQSPEVQRMVERAARHLEQNGGHPKLGGECVIALALYKSGRDTDHKFIKRVLERCRRECTPKAIPKIEGENAYSYTMAAIMLAEISPVEHRAELNALVAAILESQRNYGSWGYAADKVGDSSQVQYCVLALWTASRVGVNVPPDAVVRCCEWLIRTQDPQGKWGYKCEDSGALGRRIPQTDNGHNETFHSTTAAALGSVYMCADFLQVRHDDGALIADDGELPSVIRLVKDEVKPTARVNQRFLAQALRDGNGWFDKNFKIDPGPSFPHYYRYAFERYRSFREKVDRSSPKSNSWYDAGVEFLASVQNSDGYFDDGEAKKFGALVGPNVTTAFAVLFLTRGTQQTLGKLTEGSLKGQKGLPSSASDIRMRNGRIVTTQISRSVGDLLALLENPDGKDQLNDLLNIEMELEIDDDASEQAKTAARLRSFVSHRSYEARMMAIRTLGQMRQMQNVPALIYGLSDPDWRVVLEANNALQYTTRKFEGFDLPAQPNKVLAEQVANQWRKWYRDIRPESSN